MDSICDLSSMNVEASIFLKREHLFKKIGSLDFVKAHTVVHFNKTINLLLTPLIDFFKKRLTTHLKRFNIIYTDGTPIDSLKWQVYPNCDIYESDLTAQDAKQGPVPVCEILTFYRLIGIPDYAINLFLRLYKFEARDSKNGITVKNGVAKATGGPDTGFGNLTNNLLIHQDALFHKAHKSSAILGDDLISQFLSKYRQEIEKILEKATAQCGTENKPFWNRTAFEFCSRVGVTHEDTITFLPNPFKIRNSLHQSLNAINQELVSQDEALKIVSAVANHGLTLSFFSENYECAQEAIRRFQRDLKSATTATQKEFKKMMNQSQGRLHRPMELLRKYCMQIAEQANTDLNTVSGIFAEITEISLTLLETYDKLFPLHEAPHALDWQSYEDEEQYDPEHDYSEELKDIDYDF
jgi:hypothetical protein